MKKVLFISYFAPPEEHIGALRISKFLKYLPQYGYQPYVLAGGHTNYTIPYVFRPRYLDPYTIGKILYKNLYSKKNDKVFYDLEKIYTKYNILKGLFPLSEVRMPDKFIFWVIPAILLGIKLLNKEKFDLIYSSSGPPSSAIVASILQRYSGLPWIAEFRDLWSDNPHDLRKIFIHNIDSWLERQTLKNCNAIVTVSEPLKETLERKYSKPVYVIYNGYDEEDYPHQDVPLTDKFTITYTGKIYIGKRDPSLLFEAVSDLDKEKKITPDILEIRFYGTEQDVIRSLSIKYGIENYVNLGGIVSHKESLLKQKESWLLLILEWIDPLARGILTGKIFEYLGARRPILCICYKESVIKTIIETTSAGIVVDNKQQIKDFLNDAIRKYAQKDTSLGFKFNINQIEQYSRRKASEKLSNIFSKILRLSEG
jgi:hypothetical protein